MYLLVEAITAVILIATLFYVWYVFSNKEKRKFFRKIPGPPGLPVLGNSLELMSTATLLDTLMKYTKDYGGLVKMQVGMDNQLLVSDYKFLEKLLSSNNILTKSPDYKYLDSWLGTGLLTSDGQKWKQHRKILTPAFHFKILEEFVNVFERMGTIMVKKLEKEENSNSIDIYSFVTLCTLDIICETAMGTTVNAQENENSDYVLSVKEMGRIIIERSFSAIGDLLYPLTPNSFKEQKVIRILHNYTNKVIEQRKEQLSDEVEITNDSCGLKKRFAFLDLLLRTRIDGQPLSHKDIREEVDTFMFAGHDTTAAAISFSLYCLANYPEVQEKAFTEQREIFENDLRNPDVTYTKLQQMKYLELVIKEVLRLYPSVPFTGRETTDTVEFDGITLPKGVSITVFGYAIHRNPEYFPNPEKFDPERFEQRDGKYPYAYIPFSAGPRNCIGQKFAMLEMKSVISKMLRNFELLPAYPRHTLKLAAEVVLKSTNGIRIGLRRRR